MKDREPIRMEIQPEREGIEILPLDFGELKSFEAAPIAERAVRRMGTLGRRNPGIEDNLSGFATWVRGHKAELTKRTVLAIAGAAFVAGCAKGVEGGYLPPTKTVPTAAISPNLLSRPETQAREVEDIIVFDSQDGSLWKISEVDLNIVGNSLGLFQGWVDLESVPWADEEPDGNIRYGRWANREGMGIVKFKKVEGTQLNPEAVIIDVIDGSAWRMIEEDAEIVGNLLGDLDGWVPEGSIQEDERGETIRWGLWTNREGRGRVRFERIEATQSQ